MADHHHVRDWLRRLREHQRERAIRGDIRNRVHEARDREAKRSKLQGGQPSG